MFRKINLMFVLFVMVLSSTSCYDAHEIDDYAYVTTIGVDEGTADKWRFSFQISNMRTGGQSQAGGKKDAPEHATLIIDAPDFFHAANVLDTSIARKLNFRHAKYMVISRDIALHGKFDEVLAPIIRFREIRRTVGILVSTCTAEDFIENFNPKIGISMARLQEGLMEQSADTGFFPEMRLHEYYSSVKSTYRQPIAILAGVNNFSHLPPMGQNNDVSQTYLGERIAGDIPRKGGNTIEFFGTAVFNGDKMVAELNGYETRAMLMLRGDYNRGVFTYYDPLKPDLDVSFNLKQRSKPKINVLFENGKPVIHIKIMLDAYILAIQSKINYEAADKVGYLETMVETTIKRQAEALIDKAKELNVDFLNFGHSVVKNFATIQEWEEYNWIGKIEDVKAIVEVDTKIRRTGTMIRTSPAITTEGEKQ